MHIEVRTDHHIRGSEALTTSIQSTVEATLGRFDDRITRIDVHLNDENGPKKGGEDIKCTMEARLVGLKPAAVTHHAAQLEDAVAGAAEKLLRLIEHTLGRLNA